MDATTGASVEAVAAWVQRTRSLGSRDEASAVYRDWAAHDDHVVFELLGGRVGDHPAGVKDGRAGS